MKRWYGPLKGLGLGVLVLMILAIGYSGFMSIYYWHGISV